MPLPATGTPARRSPRRPERTGPPHLMPSGTRASPGSVCPPRRPAMDPAGRTADTGRSRTSPHWNHHRRRQPGLPPRHSRRIASTRWTPNGTAKHGAAPDDTAALTLWRRLSSGAGRVGRAAIGCLVKVAVVAGALAGGAGGRAVAVQDLGFIGAVSSGGAVGVQDDGPAPLMDDDMVVEPAVQSAVVDAGLAAVGLVGDVVDLAAGRGLVAAAGEPAVLVPLDHHAADRGRDVPADPDVQRQARPGQPGTELLAAQEAGQPARTRYQGYGLANDLPFQGITAARRRRHRTGQRDLLGPGGPGRRGGRGGRGGRGRRGGVRGWVAAGAGVVAAGSVRAVAVAGEFYAEPDEVVQDGGVNLAHHDRGDGRVAGEGLGGASFQPGTAVAA